MHAGLRAALPLDGVYVCYHDDADGCLCRKPKPGLVLAAAAEHQVALDASYLIGDRWRDIDCGHAAGCTTIWVDHGQAEPLRQPAHFRVKDLSEAAAVIFFREESTPWR
jgi:D-glycero-D-manno-heptose 1,7-bisphosphate phosphatase